MRNGVVTAQIKEGATYLVAKNVLTQWDYGQQLQISGADVKENIITVYFSENEKVGTAIPRTGVVENGVIAVDIPTEFIYTDNYYSKIYAFVYLVTEAYGETLYTIEINVNARPKPLNPDTPEEQEMFDKVIVEINKKLEETKNSVTESKSYAVGGTGTREGEDTDNSKYYKEQASLNTQATELDRQEVSQNKDLVEQLKQATEQSEQNVRKDAEQVTQDKADITLIAEDVRQNKQSVEQSQTDVTSKAEQVAKDVQQTAQNRKAVEDVKTQFTQDVKTATDSITQQTSTSLDAINTKTEEQLQAVTDKGTEQVKAVEQAGQVFTQELPKLKQDINSKLDRNLGVENTDKVLKVDTEGNVVPVSKAEIVPDGLQEDILKNAVKPIVKGNPIVLKDSQDNKAVNLEIKGNTSQVQTSGKNLWNIEKQFKSTGTKFEAREDSYTFTWGGNLYSNPLIFSEADIDVAISGRISANQDKKPRVALLDSNGKIVDELTTKNTEIKGKGSAVRFDGSYKPDSTLQITIKKPQIEVGSVATPYEPYSGGQPSPSPEWEQPIILGECDHITYGNNADETIKKTFPKIELSKWDKIKKIDGVWKKENNTFNHVIKHNELEFALGGKVAIYPNELINLGNPSNTIGDICSNSFKPITADDIYLGNDGIGIFGKKVWFGYSKFTNEQDWENFFSTNNVELNAKLKTPTYEILPQSTQDALNQIETFYPNSVISTNDGIELDVQYIADTKLYIDNKFAELQKELAKTQKYLL